MSSYISCSGVLVVNPDNSLSCDSWQVSTAQEIMQDANISLNASDFHDLYVFALLALVTAFGIRIIRDLFNSRAPRE